MKTTTPTHSNPPISLPSKKRIIDIGSWAQALLFFTVLVPVNAEITLGSVRRLLDADVSDGSVSDPIDFDQTYTTAENFTRNETATFSRNGVTYTSSATLNSEFLAIGKSRLAFKHYSETVFSSTGKGYSGEAWVQTATHENLTFSITTPMTYSVVVNMVLNDQDSKRTYPIFEFYGDYSDGGHGPGLRAVRKTMSSTGVLEPGTYTVRFSDGTQGFYTGDASSYLTSMNVVLLIGDQVSAYENWVNWIDNWTAEKGPMAEAISVLRRAYKKGVSKYADLYFNFPGSFDEIYKIKYNDARTKGVILKRASGRAALIELNDAFLSFESVYSKVRLAGTVTLNAAQGELKRKTLIEVGLEHHKLPSDVIGVVAFLDKLLISQSSNYRPLSDLEKDKVIYTKSRRKAVNAMKLMKRNLLKIKKIGNKVIDGIELEGVALNKEMLADSRLTEDEKELLKNRILIAVWELTH